MKLTLRLIENLRKILDGESVPYSALPKTLVEPLAREGLLYVENHGSHRCVRTGNAAALRGALTKMNEALGNLDEAATLVTGDASRAAQAATSGNSKVRKERSCPGFLVNSYGPAECMLGGQPFALNPAEGSAIYIADWKRFVPPADALIIGVENMENFLKIRSQRSLFERCLKTGESQIIFVARYAFSSDAARWLEGIPNRYVHFGDFDLAGIDIFLTQFRPYTGRRGSYLIPEDIERRLSRGSRQRYDDQYLKYRHLTGGGDAEIDRLIALIHRYRRTYDQEGYIQLTMSN